jgi:nicotinate dehydrogenase subunit B
MSRNKRSIDVLGATLTRRQFVKTGGALIVGFSVVGKGLWQGVEGATSRNSLDAALPGSWFEIRADNTIVMRTGRVDFGQTTAHTAYRQLVAEELNVPFEAITEVVMGDTDRTPDGGFSAGFLEYGGLNLRKAAAYTYQALLELAALTLKVEKSQLSVKDGVVSGGGKSISYGKLVQGQQLKLTIPVTGDLTSLFGLTVTGNPPMKPTSEYTVIGKSYANAVTPSKVTGKELWVTNVRLPNMLHGRIVHPRTLGSTLVSVGALDKARYPNAQVVVKGNLVGVVAPTEWEAIGASQQVAAATKWTEWKGLPGHTQLYTWMRDRADWKTTPVSKSDKSRGDVAPALTSAAKSLSASYQIPFMKHAPIGPTIAVGDVRPDGTVYVHTHNQNPQALRGQIAMMLGTPVDNVVVRIYSGPGHYGRSNGGNAGAEDEAVILSKAVGRPVRVQWMRSDDLQWSTQSPPGLSNVKIGWDASGTIVAYEAHHYMPAMQDDRLVGALLAGLPTQSPPDVKAENGSISSTVNGIADPWVYDKVPNVAESGYGTFQLGQKASPLAVGLRDHSMRTPGQLQQNYPRELAFSEAAALARIDAIEFRLRQTTDKRLIGVLEAVRKASGWETRTSPSPKAAATGSAPVSGQGVSVMLRSGTYWACVCQVSVVPSTGKLTVNKYTIAVDPGIVVNPLQLKRTIEGGALMGLSHALHEEMMFDESGVTSSDWRSYPILTIADVPDVNVVILSHPEVGAYGGGSEAANALAVSAIAAAFFDATGKPARRLPLKPAYVQSVLKGAADPTLSRSSSEVPAFER